MNSTASAFADVTIACGVIWIALLLAYYGVIPLTAGALVIFSFCVIF